MEGLRLRDGADELSVAGADNGLVLDFEVDQATAHEQTDAEVGKAKIQLDKTNVALLIRFLQRWHGSV